MTERSKAPGVPAGTVREPEARGRRRVSRLVWLLAAATGALAWSVAPEPWVAGPGSLTVHLDGGQAVTVAIEAGSDLPILVDEDGIRVEAPAGVRLDRRLEVQVTSTRPVGSVDLELADGRVEQIPVVALGGDGNVGVAQRQPIGDVAPVLGLLGVVVVLWVSEAVALWVTSLLVPIVLTMTGVLDAGAALAPFFHPIIVLFFAGFLLAEAMRRVGLDRLVATRLVAAAGRGPLTLYVAFLVLAGVLSMFMSNTAAVAVLIPVAMAVTEPLGDLRYRRALILGTAYAATIGGVGSAIGTPANQLATTFLADVTGRTITFAGWFAFGLPMVVLVLPLIGWHVWRRLGPRQRPEGFDAVVAAARAVAAQDPRLDRSQVTVLIVFIAVVIGWLLEPWHGVHVGIVALAGLVVLALLGRVDTDDLGRISWASLLTFGGGLALGLALTSVGASDWVATRLGGLAGLPPLVGIGAIAATALALTTVASNTAAAATLIPLALPIAVVLGVDPVLAVMVVAIASSVDFALVIGTPPTMLAYSTGLYTPREVLRTGSLLDLAALAVLVLVVTRLWAWMGLVA